MLAGSILHINKDQTKKQKFKKIQITSGSKFDEKWLQELIYENIEVIKLADPNFDKVNLIPLCREFSLHDSIRNVYLDVLAVTETGKLILIECKLWKNPQARREVIAQIIEYASLFKNLSYGDLVVKLKKYVDCAGKDPILHQFDKNGITYNESTLIDRISHCLKTGNFQIVIAGDGIRSDLLNLTKNINFSGMIGDLCLLEMPVYKGEDDSYFIIPQIPVKTETISKTVLLDNEGNPALIEEDIEESRKQVSKDTKEKNSKFWDRFITSIKIDHPDQSRPRRGGSNWVKADFPEPFFWITVYRITEPSRIGIFVGIRDDANAGFANVYFSERLQLLRDELGKDISVEYKPDSKDWDRGLFISYNHSIEIYDDATEETQIKWLENKLNQFVNVLRPLSREFMDEKEG